MGLKKNVTGFRQGYETPAGRTEAPLGSGAHSGLQSHFLLLRFWGRNPLHGSIWWGDHREDMQLNEPESHWN